MRKTLFTAFSCILYYFSWAQNVTPQLISPVPTSPTAASFAKYGEIPVSYCTGIPDISIPLFQVQQGDISFSLAFSYHAGGIRVEEIASNVGLGWNLSYTGTISRQVRGLADETSASDHGVGGRVDRYLKGQMNSTDQQAFLGDCRIGDVDGAADLYFFNLPGSASGKFFLDSTGSYVTYPRSNIRIEKGIGGSGGISWKITDDKGIQYNFIDFETTTTESYFKGPGQTSYVNSTVFDGPSTWYLTQITDGRGDTVSFTYSSTWSEYRTTTSQTARIATSCTGGQPKDQQFSDSYTLNSIGGLKIKNIQWNGGQINFSYKSTARWDIIQDTAMSSISIWNNQNRLLKKFDLYTSYFHSSETAADTSWRNRLRLDSVREIGSDSVSLPPYKFEYYSIRGLPNRLSYNQDYWGFNNGKINDKFVAYYVSTITGTVQQGAIKDVDTLNALSNILQKITYPTGGYTTFDYESNRYAVWKAETTAYTKFMASVSGDNSGGDPDQYLFDYTDTFTVTSADTLSNNKAILQASVAGGCNNPNNVPCFITISLIYPNGSSRTIQDKDTLMLVPGTYILKGEIETEFAHTPFGSLAVTLRAGVTIPAGYYDQYSGGARIKRITNNDGSNTAGIKDFTYNSFGQNYSSGTINYSNNLPSYVRQETSHYQATFDDEGHPMTPAYSCQYDVYSSTSNYPMIAFAGGYTIYGNVEVVQKDLAGKTNGKTQYFYTTFTDFPDQFSSGVPFVPNCSFDWKRGLLLRQKDFRVNGDQIYNLVSEKAYTYTFLNNSWGDSISRGVRGMASGQTEFYNYNPGDAFLNSLVVVSSFPTISEVFHMSADTTIFYDPDNPGSKVVTVNTYNHKNYPVLLQYQRGINSKGDTIYTSYRYPTDFNNTGFIANLRSSNALSLPIEMLQSKKIGSNPETITGGVITTYRPSSIIKNKVYVLQLTAPKQKSLFQLSSTDGSGNFTLDPAYDSLLFFNKYDKYGNIIEERKKNDLIMSYIWDYASSLPVAEVKNGDSTSIAYTSFEASGSGNWVIGAGTLGTTGGLTGNNYYSLSGGAVISKSGLSSSKSYIVSYWTTAGASLSVTGSTNVARGKTIKGWTYFQHTVSGTTSVNVSGGGGLDELRLYPADALMTTYTYLPLVGVTSQCDATSKITYYEYDGLQRLLRIRDMDGNIVKQFEYQYQVAMNCGTNCSILPMTTLAGINTIGYPVGVFNANGKLLGNAANQAQYISLWNADTADQHRGTLAAGADPLHFQFTLVPGKTIPVITGCRYFQMDLSWNKIDAIRNSNGDYVDFGDGTGMRLMPNVSDSLTVLAPNTTQAQAAFPEFNAYAWYFVHTYPDNSLKTITFYHSDQSTKLSSLDNNSSPATTLTHLRNLRGNLPQYTQELGGSCYQDSSMSTVAGITNWNLIHSIKSWGQGSGDQGVTPTLHLGYQQDFMAGNKDLEVIGTAGGQLVGCFDSTFKISRLKSDWNTYFTHLKSISISDAHWNREDLSTLKELNSFSLCPAREQYSNSSNQIPIPASVVDNIFIQIAAGSGQTVTNGLINIFAAGTNRTPASNTAVTALLAKGWTLYLNGVQLH